MSATPALPVDPGALIRSRPYRVVLIFAALIGLLVSLASWGFLELVYKLNQWIFSDLPDALGFDSVPWWWPLPVLAVAGVLAALAIVRLPGNGGHEPSEGLSTAGPPAQPIELPGILLAALATLGFGVVLGPEAPLIAIGAGLGVLAIHLVKKDAPQPIVAVLAASGSFAAISTIFGSPVIGAVIVIEAAGLGGAMLPVILLPGLIAAGVGSLVFVGMGSWTGLSTSAWSLSSLQLAPYGSPDASDILWTLALALTAPAVVFAILVGARLVKEAVVKRPFLLTTVAGVAIALCAILFHWATGESTSFVLFSGESSFDQLVTPTSDLALSTLWLILLFKGVAWSLSLGGFRGGPTFPALFLGAAGGLVAGHLPGFATTQAVAVVMAIATVSVLRLPLSSIILVLLFTSSAGAGVAPLVVVAAVVAYVVTEVLWERRYPTADPDEDAGIAAATAGAAAA